MRTTIGGKGPNIDEVEEEEEGIVTPCAESASVLCCPAPPAFAFADSTVALAAFLSSSKRQ